MTNKTPKEKIHLAELDVLRGLAAFLMIVNHLGYKTLAANQVSSGLLGSLVFIGSFAPVIFFLVTGIGYGIQSSKKKKERNWYVTFNKVIVLVLADQFISWSEGRWLGLDFLGFIGLASLVLECIRNTKSPLTYCLTGFAFVSLMRYFVGPHIHALRYDQQAYWPLGFILGTSATPGVSYPLAPWFAYPFAGYVIGVAAIRYQGFIGKHRLLVICSLLGLASLPTIAGAVMSQHGSSFFRWGTVALGFYIVSFAVILVGLAWSLASGVKPWLKVYQSALSLRGIASLAVVPVHYFLIYLVNLVGIKELNFLNFCLMAVTVLATSFLLAHSIEKLSNIFRSCSSQKAMWFGLVIIFLLTAILTLSYSSENSYLTMLFRTLGQIVLCLLFVIRPPVLTKHLAINL